MPYLSDAFQHPQKHQYLPVAVGEVDDGGCDEGEDGRGKDAQSQSVLSSQLLCQNPAGQVSQYVAPVEGAED